MKFSYVCHSLSRDSILEKKKPTKKLLILIVKSDLSSTHADNLSFNLIELLFIILVITCCSRTFLPHFLAENFKIKKSMQHLLVFFFFFFYWLYPCIMLFYVHIISFCEGLFSCSKGNNGRICKDRLEKNLV